MCADRAKCARWPLPHVHVGIVSQGSHPHRETLKFRPSQHTPTISVQTTPQRALQLVYSIDFPCASLQFTHIPNPALFSNPACEKDSYWHPINRECHTTKALRTPFLCKQWGMWLPLLLPLPGVVYMGSFLFLSVPIDVPSHAYRINTVIHMIDPWVPFNHLFVLTAFSPLRHCGLHSAIYVIKPEVLFIFHKHYEHWLYFVTWIYIKLIKHLYNPLFTFGYYEFFWIVVREGFGSYKFFILKASHSCYNKDRLC